MAFVQHYAEVHIGPRVRRCGVKAHVLTSSADTATAPAHFNKRMPFRESPLFFHVKYARRSSLIWTASAMSCKSAPFAEGICPRSGLDACSTNWSKAPVLRMTPAFSICRIFSYLFRFLNLSAVRKASLCRASRSFRANRERFFSSDFFSSSAPDPSRLCEEDPLRLYARINGDVFPSRVPWDSIPVHPISSSFQTVRESPAEAMAPLPMRSSHWAAQSFLPPTQK